MTQEELARRIELELRPLSNDCANDVLYDLMLACDKLHLGIMQYVIAYYLHQFATHETVDGYTRNKP